MTEKLNLNRRALDVLCILLNSAEPMTSTDIVNCGDKSLTQSTVMALLRKLLKDGYIKVVGLTHSGKVLSRTYVATDLSRTAVTKYLAELYQPFVKTIGIPAFVTEILSLLDEDTKKAQLDELKKCYKS